MGEDQKTLYLRQPLQLPPFHCRVHYFLAQGQPRFADLSFDVFHRRYFNRSVNAEAGTLSYPGSVIYQSNLK